MITVMSAVLENVNYAIVFTELKYQFRIDNEVVCENTNYLSVRAEFTEAVGF